jgi:hypothetical protein
VTPPSRLLNELHSKVPEEEHEVAISPVAYRVAGDDGSTTSEATPKQAPPWGCSCTQWAPASVLFSRPARDPR